MPLVVVCHSEPVTEGNRSERPDWAAQHVVVSGAVFLPPRGDVPSTLRTHTLSPRLSRCAAALALASAALAP